MSLAEVLSRVARNDNGLRAANLNGGPLGGFRNKLINGNFDFWQRGTSLNLSGSGAGTFTADRWRHGGDLTGTTLTVSRQEFAFGQADVPGAPRYFARLDRTAVTVNSFGLAQKIEDVATLAGAIVTLTFYAKGTAGKTIGLKWGQLFGTGGSPSPLVSAVIGAAALGSNWQKYQVVFQLPSVSGKTRGSNGGDCLYVEFALEADQGVMTADIAHVSLVEGDATGEDDPFSPRHPQQELALCQRYFEQGEVSYFAVRGDNIDGANIIASYKVEKRSVPTIAFRVVGLADVNVASIGTRLVTPRGFGFQVKPTTSTAHVRCERGWDADSEL